MKSILSLTVGLIGLCTTTFAAAEVLFEDHFDSDIASFSGAAGWQSRYCSDPWTTAGTDGVSPLRDDGCAWVNCTSNQTCGYAFGMYSNCQASDPFDDHLTAGDVGWTDYTYEVSFRNDDDDTFGVVFRYTNSGNFYLVTFSRQLAPNAYDGCSVEFYGTMLWRAWLSDQGESHTELLAQATGVAFTSGVWHRVRVVAAGRELTVYLDVDGDGRIDAPRDFVLQHHDDSAWAHLGGKIGVYAYQNGASEQPCYDGVCAFDDVVVRAETTVVDPDNDGVPTEFDNCPTVGNADQADHDEDGFGDACDDDDDNDALLDSEEAALGSDPLDGDSDDDGLLDGAEVEPGRDSDFDGYVNVLDPDADNDGLGDGLEAGVTAVTGDTDTAQGLFRADADPFTQTDPTNPDTDGDGAYDGYEDRNANGRVDPGETDPLVPDGPVVEPPAVEPRADTVGPPPVDVTADIGSDGGPAAEIVAPPDVPVVPPDAAAGDGPTPPKDVAGGESEAGSGLGDTAGGGAEYGRPPQAEPTVLPPGTGIGAGGSSGGCSAAPGGAAPWLGVALLVAGVFGVSARRRRLVRRDAATR